MTTAGEFFSESQFATSSITNGWRTDSGAGGSGGGLTVGIYDCSNYQGMQFSATNTSNSHIIVQFTWADDSDPMMFTIPCAQRTFVVGAVAGRANFTIPHYGNWLMIYIQAAGANPWTLSWSASQRPSPAETFCVDDDYLIDPQTVAVNTGTSVNIDGNPRFTYAGPAMLYFNMSVSGGLGWNWSLRCVSLTPTSAVSEIAFSAYDHSQIDTLPRGQVEVLLPPSGFWRIIATNGTGVNGSCFVALIPDQWRTA